MPIFSLKIIKLLKLIKPLRIIATDAYIAWFRKLVRAVTKLYVNHGLKLTELLRSQMVFQSSARDLKLASKLIYTSAVYTQLLIILFLQ